MIAVDTSALTSILFEESDAEATGRLLEEANRIVIGAPTLFELTLVVTKKMGSAALPLVDRLFRAANVEVMPFAADHTAATIDALHRLGGRPARLNFGDCMAYAVARVAGCPLLYKGGDFALTDVVPAR